jgi:glycerophosphoryl diester phosphodiesterase
VRRLLGLTLAFVASHVAAFDLQGHRGARGLYPENTLPAFEAALKLGVTTLELDVGVTKDGVVVIHHDQTLNPNTTRDASGRYLESRPAINTLTYAELQSYDVGRLKPGTPYAKNYPDQVPVDGTRIPRLADLFALVRRQGNDKVRFDIETKLSPDKPAETLAPEPFARAVVDEVRKAGMEARTTIQSFDWRTLQAVQKLAPGMPTAYLTAQQKWLDNVGSVESPSSWTAGFQIRDHGTIPKMIKAAGGSHWSVHFADLHAASVVEAQALGLKVLVWTVNDVQTMARMLDMGVDGLITDRPDLAVPLLRQRGIRW